MSRIGKIPVAIPAGVDVKIDRGEVHVKGPKGQLAMAVPARVTVKQQPDKTLVVERHGDDRRAKAFHGLAQRLLSNMVRGVTEGFSKELEIQGVGYRAALEGNNLTMQLGFSHAVVYPTPPGIKFEVPKPTTIIVTGCDKQRVGQVAAEIRKFRPPEPYKGKGIRFVGEYVRRKVGKTGAK